MDQCDLYGVIFSDKNFHYPVRKSGAEKHSFDTNNNAQSVDCAHLGTCVVEAVEEKHPKQC